METKFKNFNITSNFIGDKCSVWDEQNYNNHSIRVYNRDIKKSCYFEFWASIMNPEIQKKYDLLNAFYCFITDAISGSNDFSDFCAEFGYDEDSRKAERTWKACQKSYEKARRVLDDVDLWDFANELGEVAA